MTIYDTIDAVKRRFGNAKQELDAGTSAVTALKPQVDDLFTQIATGQTALTASQAQTAAVQATLTTTQTDLTNTQTALTNTQTTLATTQASLTESEAEKAQVQMDFDAYKQMIFMKFGPLGLTDWEKSTYRGYPLDYTGYVETFRSDFNDLSQITGPTGNGPWYTSVHSGFGGAGFVPIGGTNDPYSMVNGNLNIRVQKVGTGWYGGIMQTMKADGTGFSQSMGIFEARIKLPPSLPTQPMQTPGAPQHGHWGSFWLLSAADFHPEITDNEVEIDVFETYGDDKGIHTTCHVKPRRVPLPNDYPTRVSDSLFSDPQTCKDTVTGAAMYPSGVTIGDGQFHTYTLEIKDDYMIMYFDGKAIGRYVTLDYFKTPLYMLVNHTLWADQVSSIVSPLDMQVDYVRAMKKV
jgi:hypothetical protein